MYSMWSADIYTMISYIFLCTQKLIMWSNFEEKFVSFLDEVNVIYQSINSLNALLIAYVKLSRRADFQVFSFYIIFFVYLRTRVYVHWIRHCLHFKVFAPFKLSSFLLCNGNELHIYSLSFKGFTDISTVALSFNFILRKEKNVSIEHIIFSLEVQALDDGFGYAQSGIGNFHLSSCDARLSAPIKSQQWFGLLHVWLLCK